MKEINLTWGESAAVREAFMYNVTFPNIHFSNETFLGMDYTPFNGDDKLIESTKAVILRQTGLTYKHVFLTNGATGGCTIALRAYASLGGQVGVTNPAPYFPLYPGMVRASGLVHSTTQNYFFHERAVFLLDTPSNPMGLHVGPPEWFKGDVIWDQVYSNNVYSALRVSPPKHDVAVGSYSKLTGLNGIRLGWIATNDDILAAEIETLISAEYCGLSRPCMMMMTKLLEDMDLTNSWNEFEKNARDSLDYNRAMWSMLERFFGGTPVPVNGMFYFSEMDASAKKLFQKAGVLWQVGSKCGVSDEFARFNVGQSCSVINEAVKSVLNTDKIG